MDDVLKSEVVPSPYNTWVSKKHRAYGDCARDLRKSSPIINHRDTADRDRRVGKERNGTEEVGVQGVLGR